MPLQDGLADRLKQMRLAETDAAVDEKRIVAGLSGLLKNGQRCGMRQAIARQVTKLSKV